MAPALPSATVSADAYLALDGKRQGAIKGESKTPGHVDEIAVSTWSWGLSTPTAVGGTAPTSRRQYQALAVVKQIDGASTRLMNALAQNEEIKQATLALRKAGAKDDYFTITLKQARVTSLVLEADGHGGVQEVVKLAFLKVNVEYTPQQAGGGLGGATSFDDELVSAS